MTSRGDENYVPPDPRRHLVDIVVDEPDDRILPAPRSNPVVDHVVTVSEVNHRIDHPARVGFGFGIGFFAARAAFRLGLFLVLCAVLLIFTLRAFALLGI